MFSHFGKSDYMREAQLDHVNAMLLYLVHENLLPVLRSNSKLVDLVSSVVGHSTMCDYKYLLAVIDVLDDFDSKQYCVKMSR